MTDDETTKQELAVAYVVDNIDGISDQVIDRLTEEFNTAIGIAEASPQELQEVDGIGPQLSRRIHRQTNSVMRNPELYDVYGPAD